MNPTPRITICPPAPPHRGVQFDKAQFLHRAQPVEAHYVGAHRGINGWTSNGLSFGDYASMQTSKQKILIRRLDTPDFMTDERRFRAVVIRYLELKAGGSNGYKRPAGTETERTLRLSAALKKRAENNEKLLDMFAARYVATTDEAERKRFQQRIIEYDTSVRICREPWVIPQICRAYYFERVNSKVVGERFGFKSPHIRQMIRRLALLDAQIQAGNDDKRSKPC